jgi:phosphocarrier protein
MIRRAVTIQNRLGLHARAAAKLVHLAGQFRSEIQIEGGGETVEAKSILGLLLLAAAPGSEITLACHGVDEGEAAEALAQLIESRFGESE